MSSFLLRFLFLSYLLYLSPVSSWLFYDPAPWGTSNGNIEKSKISGFRGFVPRDKDTEPRSSIITTKLPFTVKKIRADQGIVFATGPLPNLNAGEQKKYRIAAILHDGTISWYFDAPAEIYIAINFKFELLITYNVNDTHTLVEKRKISSGEVKWSIQLARVLMSPGATLPKNLSPSIEDPLAIEVVGPSLLLVSDKALYWGLDETSGEFFWRRDFFPFDLIESPTPVTALSLNGFGPNDNLHSYFWSTAKSNYLRSHLISGLYAKTPGISTSWEYRFEVQPIQEKDLDPRPQVLFLENPGVVFFKFNKKVHLVKASDGSQIAVLTRDQDFTVIAGSSISTLIDPKTNSTKYYFYVMTKNQLERVSFTGSLLNSEWKTDVRSDRQQDLAIGKLFEDTRGDRKRKELIYVCDGDLTVLDNNNKIVYPRVQGCNSEIIVTSDTDIAYINGTDKVSFLSYRPDESNNDHIVIIVVLVIVFVVVFGFGVLAYFYLKRRGGLNNFISGGAAKGGLHLGHGDDDHLPLADDDDDFDIPSSNNNNNSKPKGDFFREGSI